MSALYTGRGQTGLVMIVNIVVLSAVFYLIV